MISELLPEEKRKLNELEFQLNQMESNPLIQPSDIYAGLTEMQYRIDHLEQLADKETKTRREDFKRRIQALKNMHSHITQSLDYVVKRKYPNFQSAQRTQLFSGAGSDMEAGGNYSQSDMDTGNSLDRSSSMIHTYLDIGSNTLQELLSQKERLKSVHSKVVDILNYLGISNTLMRSVEGRDSVDRIIVYVGMFGITLLLFCVWYFRR